MHKLLRRSNRELSVNLTKRRCWFEGTPSQTENPSQQPQASVTETQPDKTGDKGVPQDRVNQLVGDARKEGRAAAMADLLKELGVEKVEEAKSVLQAKREADDAAKSELEKAQGALADAQKKAADAEAALQKEQQERRIEKRDGAIKDALLKARSTAPEDVLIIMQTRFPDMVTATLKEDGTLDTKAIEALVTKAKAERKQDFTGGGPGIPSNSGGRNSTQNNQDKDAAVANFRRARRDI